MATRTSYFTLTPAKGNLKWLSSVKENDERGITTQDLLDAELWARDKINIWLVKMAGPKTGGDTVTEFLNDANPLDPIITHLADLIGSARVTQIYEQRNFGPEVGPTLQLKKKTYEELLGEAMSMMAEIRNAGHTVKASGTLRRLRMGHLQQGPLVTGPMSVGSLFDDDRLYTDAQGHQYVLPHIHPLDWGT